MPPSDISDRPHSADPGKSPAWFPIRRPADERVLAIAVIAALIVDIGARSGLSSVGLALVTFLLPVALVASGRFSQRQSLFLLGSVPLFGLWVAWRANWWLLPLDLATGFGLLFVAASYAYAGDLFDIRFSGVVRRIGAAIEHTVMAPGFLTRPLRDRLRNRGSKRTSAIVRGLLLIAPVILILGALLASADEVFASLFDWRVDADGLALHLFLLTAGAWTAAALLRNASAEAIDDRALLASARLGTTEALTALTAVVALFAAYVATQLVVWGGGANHILDTAGLTYAEHARSGFFQLLAVSVITLVTLLTISEAANVTGGRERRWFRLLAETAVLLTLAIVSVALRRLSLYEDAYGLTALRLFSTAFAWWVGLLFVLLGIAMLRLKTERRWFPAAAGITGLALLFALNVANPDAIIVRRNVDHAIASGRFDAGYLASLSDDATPAIEDNLGRLPTYERQQLLLELCRLDGGRRSHGGGLSSNHAERSATKILERLCRA